MILDDSFPTTCASCHDCWGYRNATLRMTTWSECRWQAADIPCTRWRPQRERVADSSLHRAPPHPTTTRRKKGGAYFLTTTTVVQCMRRSRSSAERIWDAATRFWEGRIAQRRLRSSSTGDGDSASDVRRLTTVGRLFCGPTTYCRQSSACPATHGMSASVRCDAICFEIGAFIDHRLNRRSQHRDLPR